MTKIAIENNSSFFFTPSKSKTGKTNENKEEILKSEILSRYSNMHQYNLYDQDVKHFVFDKKFDIPIHSIKLSVPSLKEIKYLPKELLALSILLGKDSKLDVSLIPNKLVSLNVYGAYRWFPFDGKDLRKLKNLRSINSSYTKVMYMPILPKSIEYIFFNGSVLGYGEVKENLKNFKLSAFPNLKVLDVRNSGFNSKNVPPEWAKAKKSKKLDIYW
jgi:hypothetical protein